MRTCPAGAAADRKEREIYWRDRNLKFHQYDRKRPTKHVQALLDVIADSGDPIFWG